MEAKESKETVPEIVAEMRTPKEGENGYLRCYLEEYADRIEAAWKRERDELMSQPRTWEECVDRAMKVKENSDELY